MIDVYILDCRQSSLLVLFTTVNSMNILKKNGFETFFHAYIHIKWNYSMHTILHLTVYYKYILMSINIHLQNFLLYFRMVIYTIIYIMDFFSV